MTVQAHFSKFIQDVQLDNARVGRIRAAAVRLAEFCNSDAGIRQYAPHVFFQGSYANDTAVKPADARREYDVDMVVLMSLPTSNAADVLDWFADRLRQDADYRARLFPPKDKCVRLNYAGDFHVDIVPAHRLATNNDRIQIPSRRSGWLYSHPKAFTAWCESQETRTKRDFNRCVKMMKRWRDITTDARTAVTSIVFTTLLGSRVPTPMPANPDAQVIVQTLTPLTQYLDSKPLKPVVANPSMTSEDLAATWSQANYELFRRHMRRATERARQAYSAGSEAEAVRLWRTLFGDAFPLTV
jgi:hypothetical protein